MCGEDLEVDGGGGGGFVRDGVEASAHCEETRARVSDAVINDDVDGGTNELRHGPCE